MSTRLVALLLIVLATGAHAGPVEDWYASPDASLVILLVDGLSREFLLADDLDGDALMPQTRTWAREAVDFTDVLATETHARRARAQLRAAVDAFDATAVEWVRVGEEDPAQAIEDFNVRSGRRVLILDLDWLAPPLELDNDALRRLDPTPWEGGKTAQPIEAVESRRLAGARRLATLTLRPNPRKSRVSEGVRWVVGAAHASIDDELALLLRTATESGAAVLLTATSSPGLGQRDAVGPGVGAGFDVARVPVLWLVPGKPAREDSGSRQWIALTPEWFADGRDADRYTWATPADGKAEWAAICELRWTTERFTLLDTTSPPRPPRLYDRLLDPDEWYDRATEYPALADSLRSEICARLYGDTPVLVFRAGDEPVDLVLSIPVAGRRGSGESPVHLDPGETTRVRLPFGAANVRLGEPHHVRIGGEDFLLDELVVHSPAWRALRMEPQPDPGFTIWME